MAGTGGRKRASGAAVAAPNRVPPVTSNVRQRTTGKESMLGFWLFVGLVLVIVSLQNYKLDLFFGRFS